MSVSEASCVCVSGGRGLGGAMGVEGGWPPLPTRPQRYCDPASLVFSTSSIVSFVIWSSSGEEEKIGQKLEDSFSGLNGRCHYAVTEAVTPS